MPHDLYNKHFINLLPTFICQLAIMVSITMPVYLNESDMYYPIVTRFMELIMMLGKQKSDTFQNRVGL